MIKSKAKLDRRDRRLLKAVWIAAANAMFKASHGHNDGWEKLQKALEKAEDEMGAPEDLVV